MVRMSATEGSALVWETKLGVIGMDRRPLVPPVAGEKANTHTLVLESGTGLRCHLNGRNPGARMFD